MLCKHWFNIQCWRTLTGTWKVLHRGCGLTYGEDWYAMRSTSAGAFDTIRQHLRLHERAGVSLGPKRTAKKG